MALSKAEQRHFAGLLLKKYIDIANADDPGSAKLVLTSATVSSVNAEVQPSRSKVRVVLASLSAEDAGNSSAEGDVCVLAVVKSGQVIGMKEWSCIDGHLAAVVDLDKDGSDEVIVEESYYNQSVSRCWSAVIGLASGKPQELIRFPTLTDNCAATYNEGWLQRAEAAVSYLAGGLDLPESYKQMFKKRRCRGSKAGPWQTGAASDLE